MTPRDSDPALPARRYVFLASSAYSGSTLLSYLLAAHPQVGSVSDVSGRRRSGQMATFACSCGLPMRDCRFWLEVMERAAASGLRLDLADFELGFDASRSGWLRAIGARSLRWTWLEHARDRALAPLGVPRSMQRTAERSWQFANLVMDVTGADAFVDASKERLRIRYLERFLPARPLVIHLVRDVRGVVDSTMRRGKVDEDATHIARRWARTNDTIRRQLAELPAERQLQVRYEDLCRDVEGELRRAFAFIGVDPEAPKAPIGQDQHMLGNRMRLSVASDVRLDERWRQALPAATERAVIAAAAPVFGRLYPELKG